MNGNEFALGTEDTKAEFSRKLLKITGFFLPIETDTKPRHFGLSRRNLSCPFCPPSKPTEVIEVVTLERITPVVNDIMIVEGKLKLVKDGSKGLFYRLEGAVVK